MNDRVAVQRGNGDRSEPEFVVRDWRPRLIYFVCPLTVIALGLASRRFRQHLPGAVGEFAGDTLWAMMVYLGLSVLMPHVRASRRAASALAFSFAVEFSQLYHAPWIDAIRGTTIGGLVLGFGFLWTDLVCYSVGVAAAVVLDRCGHAVLSRQ